jgi:hypothetical protein
MKSAKNPQMKVEIVHVTPELASEWLKKNKDNRPITKSHVNMLASQMKAGEWEQTGEAIQFSQTDRLIDGQHRLMGIVQSQCSFDLLVVYGVPDKSQAVLDTGKTRSAGDVLSMNNIKNHTITAAMIKNYLRYKADITSYGGDKKLYHTNQRVLHTFQDNAEKYSSTALYAQKLYKASSGIMPASVIGGFALLFMERSTNGKFAPVRKFFDALLLGKDREFDSTSTILHKKLLHAKANRQRIPQRELYGMMVKTWNSEIEGRYIQHLHMKPTDELPKIITHPAAQDELFDDVQDVPEPEAVESHSN